MISLIENTLAQDVVILLEYHGVAPAISITAMAGRSYGAARAWAMNPEADHKFVVEFFTLKDEEWHYAFCDELTTEMDLACLLEFKKEPNDEIFERVHSANIRGVKFVAEVSRYMRIEDTTEYIILRADKLRCSSHEHPNCNVSITTAVKSDDILNRVVRYATYKDAENAITKLRALGTTVARPETFICDYYAVPI